MNGFQRVVPCLCAAVVVLTVCTQPNCAQTAEPPPVTPTATSQPVEQPQAPRKRSGLSPVSAPGGGRSGGTRGDNKLIPRLAVISPNEPQRTHNRSPVLWWYLSKKSEVP